LSWSLAPSERKLSKVCGVRGAGSGVTISLDAGVVCRGTGVPEPAVGDQVLIDAAATNQPKGGIVNLPETDVT
jgi:hypothetical protein